MWDIELKATYEQIRQTTNPHRHREQCSGNQRGKVVSCWKRVKSLKYMVMEEDFHLGGGTYPMNRGCFI